VPVYSQFFWLPLCGGLTAAGLAASWMAARRRGLAAGLRGAAWSLLPLAAYLTGSIRMLWRIGAAIAAFATSFAFSPVVWSGIAVTGLAALLFVVSGSMRGRRARKAAEPAAAARGQRPGRPLSPGTPSGPPGGGKAATRPGEDFGEIADILRKHGIR
jgi:hypothetical protein